MSIKTKILLVLSISLIICASIMLFINLFIAEKSMQHIVESNLNNMVHIVVSLIEKESGIQPESLETILNKTITIGKKDFCLL
ncbi:MAG: hypothetical protein OMM_06278 [Candidatus Magnetoglobus multicellularis str. Araruama]|uniref:Uncharacterized protein n=1 Tax=Candidatus Magnetoglobus multicellularis str. Araruama TaxID=890399 RepID=A0A1V1PHZ5_9BACT|nr:MAG: hypothetical protein OMM_06278 [Candidatus Magnetoglobus multicellularis str. Araruama]